MSALEQEVLDLFWQLDKDARQRVLELMDLELQTAVQMPEEQMNSHLLDMEQNKFQSAPDNEHQ